MKEALFPIVILAGGLATRLRPITETVPKSLLMVNGEPFIHHQLRLLHQQGIREVVLCVGYLADKIEHYVGDGRRFDMQVQYSYDGDVLRGTGGAIKKALPLLGDAFFVLYGDSYLACDYQAVQRVFRLSGKQALMTVFENREQWDKSNIEYGNGTILAYHKDQRTQHMHHIDYGLGIFSKPAFAEVPVDDAYDLVFLYQALLQQGQLAAYEVCQRFYEVGSIAGIQELESYLAREHGNAIH